MKYHLKMRDLLIKLPRNIKRLVMIFFETLKNLNEFMWTDIKVKTGTNRKRDKVISAKNGKISVTE